MIITARNTYEFEGTLTNKAWTLEIIDKQNLMTDSIVENLKNFSKPIFWNDGDFKHHIFYIFDFKIDNVWFESLEVDCCNMKIVLNAFK